MGNKHSMYTCYQCGGKTYKKIIKGGNDVTNEDGTNTEPTNESNVKTTDESNIYIELRHTNLLELRSKFTSTLIKFSENDLSQLNYLNYLCIVFLYLEELAAQNSDLNYFDYDPTEKYKYIVSIDRIDSNILHLYDEPYQMLRSELPKKIYGIYDLLLTKL